MNKNSKFDYKRKGNWHSGQYGTYYSIKRRTKKVNTFKFGWYLFITFMIIGLVLYYS